MGLEEGRVTKQKGKIVAYFKYLKKLKDSKKKGFKLKVLLCTWSIKKGTAALGSAHQQWVPQEVKARAENEGNKSKT
mgnify:CR=1 FL=1